MEDLKVKKYLALLLALVMVFALAACGSTAETPAATEAPAAEPETPAEEPAAEADPMEDLIAAAKAEGELTVYGSCMISSAPAKKRRSGSTCRQISSAALTSAT